MMLMLPYYFLGSLHDFVHVEPPETFISDSQYLDCFVRKLLLGCVLVCLWMPKETGNLHPRWMALIPVASWDGSVILQLPQSCSVNP